MDPLWRHGCLWFFPGQGTIPNDGAGQVQELDGQSHQPGPAVAGFFVLEAGQVPFEALFTERDARLDGPTVTVGLPDDCGGDVQVVGNMRWSLPGQPDGRRGFRTLEMGAGANDIKGYVSVVLTVPVVPAFQLDLSQVGLFECHRFIRRAPSIWFLERKALAMNPRSPAHLTAGGSQTRYSTGSLRRRAT